MFPVEKALEHLRRRVIETNTASRERELEAAFGDVYHEMIYQELWFARTWDRAVLWAWYEYIVQREQNPFN